MHVLIRRQSVDNPEIMAMLQSSTERMIQALYANGITLPENTVKIWIKEYSNGQLFPKVEFDYNDQELQYDLNTEGGIIEAHFKSFLHLSGKTKRKDINRNEADPFLVRIDDIIRSP